MKATVESLDANKVKLSVEVDESEFDKAVETALRKVAREVRIPGFRPGRAPRQLLEARMGRAGVRKEAMRDALPEFYTEALRQTEVDAIAPPEIDITSGEEAGPFSFDAVVEVRPRVALAGYQGLRVTIPSPGVTDAEVAHQIDRLREASGELSPVDRPVASGDHVTLDVAGERDGQPVENLAIEDYLYEVGTNTLIPDLDDHLQGSTPGEVVRFEAPGPPDGEPVSYAVSVKEVKEMVLPELDDRWVAEASEFETVAELEADLRQRMAALKRAQSRTAVRDEALRAVGELVQEDPPDPLVREEMERRVQDLDRRLTAQGLTIGRYLEATGMDQERFVESLRSAAADGVRTDLALRALAETEGLEATDEDVDAELAVVAGRLEQDPATVRAQLEAVDRMAAVRSDIRKTKALAWLVEHVEVVDEDGNPVDPADLEEPEVEPAEAGETVVEGAR